MYKLILASGSPRRKEILEQVGITFEVCSGNVEEITSKTKPEDIVMDLSLLKAQDIASNQQKESIVIGADTMVVVDGKVMGKPKDHNDAKEMLQKLQGNVHQVITGVSIIIMNKTKKNEWIKEIIQFAEVTKVWVKPMNMEQITRYINSGEPFDKAGSYGIQGQFAIYIDKIEGDYLNIVGFPVSRFYEVLMSRDINIFE